MPALFVPQVAPRGLLDLIGGSAVFSCQLFFAKYRRKIGGRVQPCIDS